VAIGRRSRPFLSRQVVVVLLYHRVSDAFRDNVTTGIERFDRQMAYLKRHWPVVSLRSVVKGEVEYRGRKPLVCVTFDDGYRDNYDYAAPILLKHRLPAIFFVSTDKLTNQTAFKHDLVKLGRGPPNLTWDQAREMQRDGLDFGSHTVNHANLARLDLDEAKGELVKSRETLRDELGQGEFLFAYPFGGQTDITPAARHLVEQSGYICCCSAYGGINVGTLDKFNVLRVAVNYNFSLPTLRSRLNGWRSG
jgi:peptidoglycan/xylan/chitin deacetylase (PgdA/CDA1 family)